MEQRTKFPESQMAGNRDSESPDSVFRTMDQKCEPGKFGCIELWAGNNRAHRSFELAGLQVDVASIPNGSSSGGDLSAIFSCSENATRVVLADCVGHGYVASRLARHLHRLLREYEDTPDIGTLLDTINNALTLRKPESAWDLHLTTIVTAVFDSVTGLLNFADAAHPRMLLRRAAEAEFHEIGRDLVNFPLGYAAGEHYLEGSIQLNAGDIVLAFSDGASEVQSPAGVELTASGFAQLAAETLLKFKEPISLYDFSEDLLHRVHQFHGEDDLEDDITLLTLRRSVLPGKSA